MSAIVKTRIQRIMSSLADKPGYTLMRAFARFSVIRFLVPRVRGWIVNRDLQNKNMAQANVTEKTMFPEANVDELVKTLKRDGVTLGLKLPEDVVEAIKEYADRSVCYADRSSHTGFNVNNREQAEKALGKRILVAQYFNTLSECNEIERIARDPILNKIAHSYLMSTPTFVGANLWWTFPVDASKEDRDRHAHLFHRDVDDFKFLKFFFYLTDVEANDGAHICVIGSQGKPPIKHFLDRWNIRRYTNEEIEQEYNPVQIREICGKAGEGFAEDTWCIHKGKTPVRMPRLLLQFQFALFDYGAMHDRREKSQLQNLV